MKTTDKKMILILSLLYVTSTFAQNPIQNVTAVDPVTSNLITIDAPIPTNMTTDLIAKSGTVSGGISKTIPFTIIIPATMHYCSSIDANCTEGLNR